MNKLQEKQERKELKLEVRARRVVLKRLSYPLKQLQAAVDKEKKIRMDRTEALSEYKTESEIMDAYGYEIITDDERRMLLDALESGERYVKDTLTPVGLALKIMREFSHTMQRESDALEFELLPQEERIRLLEDAETRRNEREARQTARRLTE